MKKSNVIILFLFAFFFSLPIFLSIPHTFPRLDSDYDAVLPVYQYIGNFIRTYHAFPTKISSISTGIPIVGDPVDGIFNPLLFVPLIFFDINVSIRITMFFVIFSSGLSMFYVLKKQKLSNRISYWGSFLYMTSGALVACIAAGHITEKFLIYPCIPLFLLFGMEEKITLRQILGIAFIMAISVYSGDLYSVWFFAILLFSLQLFYLFFDKKSLLKRSVLLLETAVFFILFASPKLYFFFKDVLPIMKRTTVVNPFLGSIHAWFLPLQFLIPFQVQFYDRPFFQRHLGFFYNWYEYYGFLGFFPILFLKNLPILFKNKKMQILLFLLFVGSLYLASAFFYSPFHWLFIVIKPLDVFRVPQRIIIPLSGITIILLSLLANSWKNKKTLIAIFAISLIATISVSWYIFSYTFVAIPKEEVVFATMVAKVDTKKQPVVNLAAASEFLLAQRNIPISNYYYAWIPKTTPEFSSPKGFNLKLISKEKPTYVLTQLNLSLVGINYTMVAKTDEHAVWQRKK